MEDLRQILVFFKNQMPEHMHFINIESFYYYMRLAYPQKYKELTALIDIIEPYIPLIISPRNLEEVIFAYEYGDSHELARLEADFLGRSKFIFMNSVMAADEEDWENISAICRRIREIKLQEMGYV
ncbi:MAG: hypothetical protein FWE34_03420 [Defluviitaleaceae bacterium]|nr:hypothetical protein [Defluviitaleaceae bacterium]